MHLEPRLKTESKSKGTETEIRSRRKFPKLNTCSDRSDEWAKCTNFCTHIDQLPEDEIKRIIDKFKLKVSIFVFRVELCRRK